MRKCIKCGKEYDMFMFENYNLGLCEECYGIAEQDAKIALSEDVDEVTHKITCPKCGKVYDLKICDSKCETEGCNVHFFWWRDDGMIVARWLEEDIDEEDEE